MIKKTSGGKYEVTSESGKPLSGKDLSKGEAEKRLEQVEYFKARDAKRKKPSVRDWANS